MNSTNNSHGSGRVFSGNDLSEYTKLLREIDMRLKSSSLSYGIYSEIKTLKVKSINYVTDEASEYMLTEFNITPELIEAGYSTGVHKLSPKHFREYSKDLADERAKESKMIATVVQLFPLGSKKASGIRMHGRIDEGCFRALSVKLTIYMP